MKINGLLLYILLIIGLLPGCKGNQVEPDDPETEAIDTFEIDQTPPIRTTWKSKNPARYSSFRKLFNDKNDVHLAAARRHGIEPLASLDEARQMSFWDLAQIDSCEYFAVDPLTHSAPYLTPKTKWLLINIGKNFQDSLARRGSGGRQIILTSALRTDKSIKSLRRRNGNASENSAHRYGTTFDIAYNRYAVTDSAYFVPSDRLRLLLGEVLYDLRREHKCYIKYEVRQGCFHITAR